MSFWAPFLASALAYCVIASLNWGVHIVVRRRKIKRVRAAITELFGPIPEPNASYPVPPPSNPNAN